MNITVSGIYVMIASATSSTLISGITSRIISFSDTFPIPAVMNSNMPNGGGPILINMIHEIDNLRYMYGEIERVYAEVSNKTRNFEVEDTVSVTVRFKDGVLASILMSDTVPSLWAYEPTMGENKFFFPTKGDIYHFLGNKASLSFPGMVKVYYADPSKAGWQHPLTTERLNIKSSDPYPQQMRHFCKVVKGEEEARTSGEDALRTLRVTMALHESVERNEPVKIKY